MAEDTSPFAATASALGYLYTLLRAYQVIHDTVERLSPGFQVIVIEHADLDGEPFRSAVVRRWRGAGTGLVPSNWINTSA